MANHHEKDILVINGRRYSARTGKPLDGHRPSIDGLAHHKPKNHIAATVQAKPAHHPVRPKRQAMPAHQVHARPKPAAHPHPRRAVHNISVPPVSSRPVNLRPSAADVLPGSKLSADRLRRARHIERSNKISKFGQAGTVSAITNSPPQIVEPTVPENEPVFEQHQAEIIEPIRAAHAEQPAVHHPAKPKKRRLRSLAKKQRALSVAAASLSFLIIAGYTLYLNMPNMAFKVAASRAGIDASLPEFKPDGFHLAGPIHYSSGSVVVSFRSTTGDERKYDIAQRKSDWDSESLLENYVSRQSERYSTIENKGLTLYVWGGSNAAWIDGGIWYTIEGDSLLGTDQLLKIASSL